MVRYGSSGLFSQCQVCVFHLLQGITVRSTVPNYISKINFHGAVYIIIVRSTVCILIVRGAVYIIIVRSTVCIIIVHGAVFIIIVRST